MLSCYESRLTLEPSAAVFAAERHDPQALAQIRDALEHRRDATNPQVHREDADFQFHLAIAIAAEDSYFSTAMAALKDHITVGMRFHGVSVKREASGLSRVFDEHFAIFESIRQRHVQQAHDLMHAHLSESRDRLSEKKEPAQAMNAG
ncbi:FadR/GntR family transcriptional regulator [Paracoccus sp. P2]|uniref:FadR/GntR family transcriptional regulator n=1 Tax=Paracoccus TaxID=265 RepID=UPI0018CC6AA5|nr:FCD domain-containing protein [Paracoccus pantotrophus]